MFYDLLRAYCIQKIKDEYFSLYNLCLFVIINSYSFENVVGINVENINGKQIAAGKAKKIAETIIIEMVFLQVMQIRFSSLLLFVGAARCFGRTRRRWRTPLTFLIKSSSGLPVVPCCLSKKTTTTSLHPTCAPLKCNHVNGDSTGYIISVLLYLQQFSSPQSAVRSSLFSFHSNLLLFFHVTKLPDYSQSYRIRQYLFHSHIFNISATLLFASLYFFHFSSGLTFRILICGLSRGF